LRAIASAARRLGAGGERHLHVHFAGLAALNAMRVARITGVTYSVAVHGYDVFAEPRNLAEKLASASFVAAPCEYTAGHVRAAIAPERRDAVHVIVMGVDGAAFRRGRPYPGGRTVVAIGRLVEKKGFAGLVAATALLRDRGAAPDRVTIVGDGPLRAALEAQVAALGVGGIVALAGARQPAEVAAVLETADVLAVPSVVAADGDRDALPVVVGEALAMEVPVVVAAVAGLPEVVRPEFGRVVPPGDDEALADALGELLARPAEERAAMGRAARAWVVRERDRGLWAQRLAAMLADAGAR
jgi:colanic acid/amylovoran biosynthesis glycosyltransferase